MHARVHARARMPASPAATPAHRHLTCRQPRACTAFACQQTLFTTEYATSTLCYPTTPITVNTQAPPLTTIHTPLPRARARATLRSRGCTPRCWRTRRGLSCSSLAASSTTARRPTCTMTSSSTTSGRSSGTTSRCKSCCANNTHATHTQHTRNTRRGSTYTHATRTAHALRRAPYGHATV